MFTRPIFQTEDMIKHHYYLEDIAKKLRIVRIKIQRQKSSMV